LPNCQIEKLNLTLAVLLAKLSDLSR